MKKVVFIASGWGAKYGGVNSFNFDLVCAIAEYFKNDIFPICIVEQATAEEVQEASKFDVELLHTNGRFSAANITKVIKDNGHDNISCWIGHDIITGIEAIECCEIYREYLGANCMSGIIHHMDYLTYYTSKTNNGIEALSKHKLQKKIFTNCDLVYAVGPFLKNSVKNMLKESEIDIEVIELIPGLADLKNLNIDSPFKAISYGRLGDEDEIVKQGKLAVAAFSKACQDEIVNESSLTVIGLDDNDLIEKQKELFNMGHQYGGKLYNITGLPYMDRSEIYNFLKTQSASMMLSTHEGFGLAGWEAISAEIPLILSVDTGLYKFLDSHLGGAGTGCFFPVKITGNIENDLATVSNALMQIKQDLNRARKNAQSLKKQLLEFNWQATADQFISHILLNLKLEQLNLDSESIGTKENINIPELIATSESVTQSTATTVLTKPIIMKSNFKHELYYSTSTILAHMIAELYFNNLHYVWCTPSFNPARTNPVSANPYEIYKNYINEIKQGFMGPSIAKHKAGLINGASINRQNGIITIEQEQEICEIIYAADVNYFKPIIYIIPTSKVVEDIKTVPQSKKSGILSQEFLIEQLDGNKFGIIDLN